MVVFGGYGGSFPSGYLSDVWSYDPVGKRWTELAPNGPRPPARARHSAVWDTAGQRLLILGGFAGGIDYLADLWMYEPRTDAWTQLRPAGPKLPARSAHVAAWDPSHNQMIVYGGYGGALYGDVWTYRGESKPH
jgi:N-acetylneuraminic acid mutarotase